MEADGLEPRCDFVPSECAFVDRPFPWQVSKPVSVWGGAVLWGGLHCGDGVGEGLCGGWSCVVGGDGAWGISSSSCCGAFASWSSALMVAKPSGRVGEAGGWGARSFQVMWYSPGFSGLCCTVMAAVASSSGVHRCGLWSRGSRVTVWRCFQLWNARRAWWLCLVSPGGRG